ncbi:MAG: response regulator, partial [Lachnospiraceae bacterium]|nr:response regulator [Lachnospiraceae bacterium]
MEALKLTQDKHYDIIFMDHMMPQMDGIEAMKRIKAQDNGANKKTPVIILTANAMQGAKEEYISMGFHDFLAKPIVPEALEEMIAVTLPPELVKKGSGVIKAEKSADAELPMIEGVDMAYALEHIGSKNGLLRTIQQFIAVSRSEEEELRDYWNAIKEDPGNDQALSDYRIKVHSMKTSAGICGALQVYGVAAWLEQAARDHITDQIIVATPYFLEFWEQLTDTLKSAFPSETSKDEGKKPIEKETLDTMLHQLNTCMKAYDVKSADSIIAELDKYSMETAVAEKIQELKTTVANLDAEGCETICKEIW